MAIENEARQPPLVVDLDDTLVKTDLLLETMLAFVGKHPLRIFRLLQWLLRGRAELKSQLAEHLSLDPEKLPYRPECLDLIRQAKTENRTVVLATATHQKQADSVARHLGVFDEVHGTRPGNNLKGAKKADFLVDKFGEKGFDYVGDSWSDLPVWAKARKAITAGASPRLKKTVSRNTEDAYHMTSETEGSFSSIKHIARLVRPHQWAKNILLFLPLVADHSLQLRVIGQESIAFVLFCLCASSGYVLNDLMDLENDRGHPRKKNRPLASGAMPVLHGVILAPTLALLGLGGALLFLPLLFFFALLAYMVSTILYSVYFKRILFLDVVTLAGLHTLRAIAGGIAVSIFLSPWLLAFCMFLFLSLAIAKRLAELRAIFALDQREALGRKYSTDDLPILGAMGVASGFMAVLVFALYINSPAVVPLYGSPTILWGVCPLLLLWIGRVQLLGYRGHMNDDPLVYALTDPASWLIGAATLVVLLAGTWL